ncbi:MAG: DNA translocase FtsK [Firmicutes bacterium]|nr:DNA translocase FtsK [Bacillota bacterium]
MSTRIRKPEPVSPVVISRRVYDIVGIVLFTLGAVVLVSLTTAENGYLGQWLSELLRRLAGLGAFAVPLLLMLLGTLFLIGYERFSFTNTSWGAVLLFLTFTGWAHALRVPFERNFSAESLRVGGGYIGGVIVYAVHSLLNLAAVYIVLTALTIIAVLLIVDLPFVDIARRTIAGWVRGFQLAQQGARTVKEKGAGAARKAGKEDVKRTLASSDNRAVAQAPAPKRSSNLIEAVQQRLARESTPAVAPLNGEMVEEYEYPPLSLLKEPAPPPKRIQAELSEKIRILEQTLDEFGIGANVVEIAHGPTVTRYEVQLAPGIKVSKIVSLADNLAMALAAIDVRVEAPIPGKSAIGVEVPNDNPRIVTLREVIDTDEFRNAPSLLTFALGKDVGNENRYADLAKMPHLLIGGATNSGKSMCLNALIASILYRATPREVKFIMIDPKRVELSLFDGIPHLMCPVVKDVKQASGILRAAIKEMERRYDLFSRTGVRNIDGYNSRVGEEEKLPYVVIVVDELADLMMQAAAEVETSICRLAQLARATGIHLVIATQRPSVDVITGTIKANISSRIAFAVSSQVDSRTILDMAGAERLIGRGDMLFLPIDASKPTRIQGCYISEQEVEALVKFLKQQGVPEYTLTPIDSGFSTRDDIEEEDEDELFEPAVRLVVMNGHASTSLLQRRFKIGYTRAARLIDMMEKRGIVGPLDGAKPREILITRDEMEAMFQREP